MGQKGLHLFVQYCVEAQEPSPPVDPGGGTQGLPTQRPHILRAGVGQTFDVQNETGWGIIKEEQILEGLWDVPPWCQFRVLFLKCRVLHIRASAVTFL